MPIPPALIDVLCPTYVGKENIGVRLADLEAPRAFNPVTVNFSLLDEALTYGLRLPLELTVTAPSPSGFFRHEYARVIPSEFTFTPKEGGDHLVRIREVGHNHWFGTLVVSVAGDRADPRVTE